MDHLILVPILTLILSVSILKNMRVEWIYSLIASPFPLVITFIGLKCYYALNFNTFEMMPILTIVFLSTSLAIVHGAWNRRMLLTLALCWITMIMLMIF